MSAAGTACRLIIDVPAAGAWNMAVDEALLTSTSGSQQPVLRLYRWSEPTLSLGYFQSFRDRRLHPTSASCAIVRRASGGGAILHDDELTYSFIWPESDRFSSRAQSLYEAVHEVLVDCLLQAGVGAQLNNSGSTKGEQPFLCFQRRAVGDVLLEGHKIAGSAQRRFQGAVLQHGSILLRRSAYAPELPGIFNLTREVLDRGALVAKWPQAVADRLQLRMQTSTLTVEELEMAARIAEEKFEADAWLRKR